MYQQCEGINYSSPVSEESVRHSGYKLIFKDDIKMWEKALFNIKKNHNQKFPYQVDIRFIIEYEYTGGYKKYYLDEIGNIYFNRDVYFSSKKLNKIICAKTKIMDCFCFSIQKALRKAKNKG